MITRYLLPFLAAAGLAFAILMTAAGARPAPESVPVSEPAEPGFSSYVAGAGLIEARSENLAVGTPVSGVIATVHARVGDKVRKADPLFTLDDRSQRAQLGVCEAEALAAQAALDRQLALPRAEDVPPAQARADAAVAMAKDAAHLAEMAQSVADTRAISAEILSTRQHLSEHAAAEAAAAQADLARLRAGAWAPELAEARAAVATAQARVAQARTEMDRLVIRAPVDGEVLQSNARPGEFAVAGPANPPLMVVGDTSRLHVRVNVDENDAWRLRAGAPGKAYARGHREIAVPLEFVRFEPLVVPKRSLTGDASERVDTRVLQVLYAFDRGALPLFAGQQMDVFLEAAPLGSAPPAAPEKEAAR